MSSMRIKRGSYEGNRSVRWRVIIGLIVLVLAVFFGYRYYLNRSLDKANTALAEMRLDEAEAGFSRVEGLPLSGGRGLDGLGVIALLSGDGPGAQQHFDRLRERKPGGVGVDPHTAFNVFIDQGRYDHAATYRDILAEWKSDSFLDDYALELAVVALGNRDLDAARTRLDAVQGSARRGDRFADVQKRLASIEKEGRVPIMLDRNGETVIAYDIEGGVYRFSNPRLFAGWSENGQADALMEAIPQHDRLNTAQSTLDLNLQRAALESMQGYKGTMILMDPSSGDILAAVGTLGYDPFKTTFEPGSIIKLMTYGFFIMNGGDLSAYAPKDYPAAMQIGGKIFYDWTTQGRLESISDGMAVSCNLMFAQMGVDMGWPRLRSGFESLYDGEPVHGYWGEGTYGSLVRQPENAWELGRAAIGLDFLQVSALGAVILPHAIANEGNMNKPRLVRQLTNIEGETVRTMPNEKAGSLFSRQAAQALQVSMEASMLEPRGTARRARVPFTNAAMKTGTAGESPFDSIMVGLFPVENPKIAFSLFLHRGGKCEKNGALVANRLQEQIRALAPSYLEP